MQYVQQQTTRSGVPISQQQQQQQMGQFLLPSSTSTERSYSMADPSQFHKVAVTNLFSTQLHQQQQYQFQQQQQQQQFYQADLSRSQNLPQDGGGQNSQPYTLHHNQHLAQPATKSFFINESSPHTPPMKMSSSEPRASMIRRLPSMNTTSALSQQQQEGTFQTTSIQSQPQQQPIRQTSSQHMQTPSSGGFTQAVNTLGRQPPLHGGNNFFGEQENSSNSSGMSPHPNNTQGSSSSTSQQQGRPLTTSIQSTSIHPSQQHPQQQRQTSQRFTNHPHNMSNGGYSASSSSHILMQDDSSSPCSSSVMYLREDRVNFHRHRELSKASRQSSEEQNRKITQQINELEGEWTKLKKTHNLDNRSASPFHQQQQTSLNASGSNSLHRGITATHIQPHSPLPHRTTDIHQMHRDNSCNTQLSDPHERSYENMINSCSQTSAVKSHSGSVSRMRSFNNGGIVLDANNSSNNSSSSFSLHNHHTPGRKTKEHPLNSLKKTQIINKSIPLSKINLEQMRTNSYSSRSQGEQVSVYPVSRHASDASNQNSLNISQRGSINNSSAQQQSSQLQAQQQARPCHNTSSTISVSAVGISRNSSHDDFSNNYNNSNNQSNPNFLKIQDKYANVHKLKMKSLHQQQQQLYNHAPQYSAAPVGSSYPQHNLSENLASNTSIHSVNNSFNNSIHSSSQQTYQSHNLGRNQQQQQQSQIPSNRTTISNNNLPNRSDSKNSLVDLNISPHASQINQQQYPLMKLSSHQYPSMISQTSSSNYEASPQQQQGDFYVFNASTANYNLFDKQMQPVYSQPVAGATNNQSYTQRDFLGGIASQDNQKRFNNSSLNASLGSIPLQQPQFSQSYQQAQSLQNAIQQQQHEQQSIQQQSQQSVQQQQQQSSQQASYQQQQPRSQRQISGDQYPRQQSSGGGGGGDNVNRKNIIQPVRSSPVKKMMSEFKGTAVTGGAASAAATPNSPKHKQAPYTNTKPSGIMPNKQKDSGNIVTALPRGTKMNVARISLNEEEDKYYASAVAGYPQSQQEVNNQQQQQLQNKQKQFYLQGKDMDMIQRTIQKQRDEENQQQQQQQYSKISPRGAPSFVCQPYANTRGYPDSSSGMNYYQGGDQRSTSQQQDSDLARVKLSQSPSQNQRGDKQINSKSSSVLEANSQQNALAYTSYGLQIPQVGATPMTLVASKKQTTVGGGGGLLGQSQQLANQTQSKSKISQENCLSIVPFNQSTTSISSEQQRRDKPVASRIPVASAKKIVTAQLNAKSNGQSTAKQTSQVSSLGSIHKNNGAQNAFQNQFGLSLEIQGGSGTTATAFSVGQQMNGIKPITLYSPITTAAAKKIF